MRNLTFQVFQGHCKIQAGLWTSLKLCIHITMKFSVFNFRYDRYYRSEEVGNKAVATDKNYRIAPLILGKKTSSVNELIY